MNNHIENFPGNQAAPSAQTQSARYEQKLRELERKPQTPEIAHR